MNSITSMRLRCAETGMCHCWCAVDDKTVWLSLQFLGWNSKKVWRRIAMHCQWYRGSFVSDTSSPCPASAASELADAVSRAVSLRCRRLFFRIQSQQRMLDAGSIIVIGIQSTTSRSVRSVECVQLTHCVACSSQPFSLASIPIDCDAPLHPGQTERPHL